MNGFLNLIENTVGRDDVIGFSLRQGYDGVETTYPAWGCFQSKECLFVGDGDQL